ncbi:MAG TPA: hypothetical protein VFQ38_14840 [Longimicrobiales bacterium]|nr:hypothetical protein [Longimicrobiales bacterium]
METKLAYCSARDQQVHVAWTAAPVHIGQANLPDAPLPVCLDYGDHCTGAYCAMLGLPHLLLGVRLSRSGLRDEGWATTPATCPVCGALADLRVLDATHLVCPLCGGTSEFVAVRFDDTDYAAIAGTA